LEGQKKPPLCFDFNHHPDSASLDIKSNYAIKYHYPMGQGQKYACNSDFTLTSK